MNNRLPTAWAAGLLAGCLIGVFNMAQAQQVDPEWPCIQRLIPEISPAIMWPVPVEEHMLSDWVGDDTVRPLARRLGDLQDFTEAEQLAIEQFAEAVDESRREAQLTLLAAGVVDVTNDVRDRYINGIKRYTRQQIAISGQIEDSLNELSVLGDGEDAETVEKRTTIRETLRWHERVYDQREQSIRLLCEEPVELEQRLSEVLREAAQYLP